MKKSKHGMSRTRFYKCWRGMIQRVSPNNVSTGKFYFDKGIRMCEEWLLFNNFKKDMYQLYLDHAKTHGERNTTLDRIENGKGYELSNCRWATRSVQLKNRDHFSSDGIRQGKTYIKPSFENGKKIFLVVSRSTNEVIRKI